MKKYMLKITPLEPFTFGGEKGFSFEEAGVNGTYFINSKLLPEQTTIIGLIRYLLLKSEGKLKSSFKYSEEEEKEIAEVCGPKTFLFEPEEKQNFGFIKEISPLFLVNQNNHIYINNPFCNKATNSQPLKVMKLQKEICCSEGENLMFPTKSEDGYIVKDGYGSGFLCISPDVQEEKRFLGSEEIFISQMLVGNKKSENINEDGFFKREIIAMKDMSFGVYITLDDAAKKLAERTYAFMGKKKALFEIEAIPVGIDDSLDEKVEDYFDNQQIEGTWHYCLSDVLPNGPLEYKGFAIVESKSIRNLKTSYSKKNITRENQKRYVLVSAGSVFYDEVPDALKERNDNLYSVGYNHVVKMGGKKMKSYIVELQCMTNMHVGNGDANYNVIDNEVERDPITGYPTINASGVKGALREYFTRSLYDANTIEQVFGAEGSKVSKPGKVKILGAEMVALPVRASCGESPFYMVTTEAAVERINRLTEMFIGKTIMSITDDKYEGEERTEGFDPIKKGKMEEKNFYVLKEGDFRQINLPVLARNKLDNGESKNLWYEEVVPHDSVFIFPVISEDEGLIEEFVDHIDKKIVQFGGNASIGYGLCKVIIHR